MHRNLINRAALAGLLFCGSMAYAETPKKVLADFEDLKAGDAVAPAPGESSRPWRRFGEATADNIVAVGGGIGGKVSASYPLAWPGRFAATRLVADEPINLTGYKTVSITLKSDAKTPTKVVLQIGDGKTVYESKAAQAVSDSVVTLKFDLAPEALALVDGLRVDLATLLENASQIGFKLTSDGSKYSEELLFDDLTAE